VSSGFNALVFLAIVAMLFVLYRLLVRTQQLERDLTALVREQALERTRAEAPRASPAEAQAPGDR
jgi:hypothetical protein